jgi:cytochrome P450
MYNEVCVILGLFWSLAMIPYAFHLQSVFPNPSTFNPDRFLLNGKLNPDIPDPAIMSFGFGKR